MTSLQRAVRVFPIVGGAISLSATVIPLVYAYVSAPTVTNEGAATGSIVAPVIASLGVCLISLIPYPFLWYFRRDEPENVRLHIALFMFVMSVGAYGYYDTVFARPDPKIGWIWGLVATPLMQFFSLAVAFAVLLIVRRIRRML